MFRYIRLVMLGLAAILSSRCLPTQAQELSLLVDPTTGSVSIQNNDISAVDLNGYLLTANQSLFDPNDWDSFSDDPNSTWAEILTAGNRIGETNLLSSSSIPAGTSVDLGTFYNPFSHSAIGELEPTFTFEYHPVGGSTQTGIVQFAPQNNIVLIVDPSSGDAVLQNQSTYDVNINGYLITSSTDVLDPNGWSSGSMGAGWAPTKAESNRLGELNLLGSTFMEAEGTAVSIGTAIDPLLLMSPDDLIFEYHIEGGATVQGGIFIGSLPATGGNADFNGNGVVDGADFLKWQRGETPDNGSAAELQLWESTYGSPATEVTISTVPEPGSLMLLILGATGCMWNRKRKASGF